MVCAAGDASTPSKNFYANSFADEPMRWGRTWGASTAISFSSSTSKALLPQLVTAAFPRSRLTISRTASASSSGWRHAVSAPCVSHYLCFASACSVPKIICVRRRRLRRFIFLGFGASKIIFWGFTNHLLRRRQLCRFIFLGFGASKIICWGVKIIFGLTRAVDLKFPSGLSARQEFRPPARTQHIFFICIMIY